MLFPYRYITHDLDRLQIWLDHLFLEVWCKATGEFSIELLEPDFKTVVAEISSDSRITTDHLLGPIECIFDIFRTLDDPTREQLNFFYISNNKIEALCENQGGYEPLRYAALRNIHANLADNLASFYANLFEKVIKLDALTSRLGDVKHRYQTFVQENNEGKCPFCGLNDIKSHHLTTRDAFDHFLPKSIYPFNSVNFRNLFPMCDDCNSSYKLRKDPLFNSATNERRRAFYPCSTSISLPNIQLTINNPDINGLQPSDIEMEISSIGFHEEIGTWQETFGIGERYKSVCVAKHDGKYWFKQMSEEILNARLLYRDIEMSLETWFQLKMRASKACPFAERNFLKTAFLESCHSAGMFKNI